MADEPRRWLDDPALDAEMREHLSEAAGVAPPALDLDAGLARLEAAIASGDGGPDGGGPPEGGAPPGPGSWGPWLAGGAAVVAVVAGLLYWSTSADSPDAPPVAQTTVAQTDVPAPEDVEPPAPTPPVESSPAEEVVPEAEPAPEEPTPTSARPRARANPEPPSGPDALREEMQLLEQARRALPSDPARALRLADRGQRRFPGGLFSEEREGIAVLASLALERAGAPTRARRYLRAHPRGSMADRVRAAMENP